MTRLVRGGCQCLSIIRPSLRRRNNAFRVVEFGRTYEDDSQQHRFKQESDSKVASAREPWMTATELSWIRQTAVV